MSACGGSGRPAAGPTATVTCWYVSTYSGIAAELTSADSLPCSQQSAMVVPQADGVWPEAAPVSAQPVYNGSPITDQNGPPACTVKSAQGTWVVWPDVGDLTNPSVASALCGYLQGDGS